MSKKAYFYIDDVIWPFRDITRERPASIFDQTLLKMLKEAHDKYGLKVVLNAFYRTDYFYGDDEFTLAEMTDDYKAEWEANSDWLKIGFHAKQEFPDYPHVNINYDDMKKMYVRFKNEVVRFAGEKTLSSAFNPHWSPVSKEGLKAMIEEGINIVSVTAGEKKEYNGKPSSLPYGHANRLLNNKKPETGIFFRDIKGDEAINDSICGYNHISTEEFTRTLYNQEVIYNEEMGIYYKTFCNSACLNLSPIDEIESDMSKALGQEYICIATHEQYSYPDYYAYQPESRDKLMKACECIDKYGYEYIFVEDLIK